MFSSAKFILAGAKVQTLVSSFPETAGIMNIAEAFGEQDRVEIYRHNQFANIRETC
jgi:hypothetical protein